MNNSFDLLAHLISFVIGIALGVSIQRYRQQVRHVKKMKELAKMIEKSIKERPEIAGKGGLEK